MANNQLKATDFTGAVDVSTAGIDGDCEVDGEFTMGSSNGVDKTWSVMLTPGAGLVPRTAGAVAVSSVNAHQKLAAIPFDDSSQEDAALLFTLPPDYDGSDLRVTVFWTCATGSLSGDADWKIYGPLASAGDGDSLNQSVGVGTGLRAQMTDTYQGQWLLHVDTATFTLGGDAGGVFSGMIARAVATSPFADDALLVAVRVEYA